MTIYELLQKMGGSDTGVYRGVEVIFSETKLFQIHK